MRNTGVAVQGFSGAGTSLTQPGAVAPGLPPRKTLLFAASPRIVPSYLLDALRHELAGFEVAHVRDVHEACAAFRQPVAMIFVDIDQQRVLQELLPVIEKRHVMATVVLLYNDTWHAPSALRGFVFQERIRSVLPTNLRTDLWLSIVYMLLRGGEYVPPSLVHMHLREEAAASAGESVAERTSTMFGKVADGGLSGLTRREMEILERVAGGAPNKLIAAELRLSEYTVKVHLHNIITKLGTHNRTSAAAIFLAKSSGGKLGLAET